MRIVFMGTPDFAVPVLKMLAEKHEVVAVVTREDKAKGRKKKLEPTPVKVAAQELGIDVLQPKTAKEPEFIQQMVELAPELMVTAAYGRILPKEILDIPPKGCINVHASLLPKYRGAGPIQRAIIDGEKVTGITTMMTDIGMDTGDILLKRECEITEEMNSDELNQALMEIAPGLLDETLSALENGTLERIPQVEAEATYAEMLSKETGIIDWSKSAPEIHNLVRGTFPWPAAQSVINGMNFGTERVKIIKTTVEKEAEYVNAAAGTVVKADKKGIVVACGSGFVKILNIQPESGKIMDAASFLNGRKVEVGDLFG